MLAAQSEYFERLLYGEMKEASMGEIALKDVPVLAFRKVLQFAYTGTLHMEDAHLQVRCRCCFLCGGGRCMYGLVEVQNGLCYQCHKHL